MPVLFVGLSIEAREGRDSKSTVPKSLLVRSRAIRIGNPRVSRLDAAAMFHVLCVLWACFPERLTPNFMVD
jgi:hypothetical protein